MREASISSDFPSPTKLNNGNRSKGWTGKLKKRKGIDSREVCGCDCFYNRTNEPNNVANFRRATFRLRQAKRALKNIMNMIKKRDKSVDFFEDGAEFFKDCNAPDSSDIYNTLRFQTILTFRFHNFNSETAL